MEFVVQGDWPVTTTAVAPLDIVLRNLIQNAVRHHDKERGMIAVSAKEENNFLCIEVSDDGPGIPKARHTKIFEPMTGYAATGTVSTGLGLAFVKRAAASVGAEIYLESDPDSRRGATFTVRWPLQ